MAALRALGCREVVRADVTAVGGSEGRGWSHLKPDTPGHDQHHARGGVCGPRWAQHVKQVAMEGRVRLAQSLELKRRSSFHLWLESHGWRWPRFVRRWGGLLVNLKVPRGVGSSAAAILLLASVSYGAIKGGHGPQIVENVQDLCDAAANRLGFRISEIALSGEREV